MRTFIQVMFALSVILSTAGGALWIVFTLLMLQGESLQPFWVWFVLTVALAYLVCIAAALGKRVESVL